MIRTFEKIRKKLVRQKFSTKEQAVLFRQMAFLSRAGVPTAECIFACATGARNFLSQGLSEAAKSVSSGNSISESLTRHIWSFPEEAAALIAAGEESGNLPESFTAAAEEASKQAAFGKKMLGALMYPAAIATISIGLVCFLMFGVFPKIIPLFKSLQAGVPLPTKILMAISGFFGEWWWMVLICMLIFMVGLRLVFSRAPARRHLEALKLRLPIVSSVVRNHSLSASARTIATTLGAGMTLPESFAFSKTSNPLYREALETARHEIERGARLSSTLDRFPRLFPALFTRLIAAAEVSGTLCEAFSYLADYFENECDENLKMLASLIEPTLLVIMGLAVGFIALSMILPIYEMSQTVSSLH